MQEKKSNREETEKKVGTTMGKSDKNAGSGGFNQGAEQEPNINDGVADGTPDHEKVSKEKENPKSGKAG
ncbi:MAG: hypothetical protein SGI83_01865 [Bacteroidota bacterium]|nr:hypothetical protein [Bacteroidota bacterium]